MSEEQVQTNKCNGAKALVILTVLSLIMSIAALATSIYAISNGGRAEGGKKIVISKQYDKGRTLQKAQDTNKPIVAFFYTDWCGFCQRFVPTFDKITRQSKIKKNFAIAYINCEKEENSKIMQEYGVQGFPTVIVIDEQGKRTQLDNATFFNDDSKEVVTKNILQLIGEGEED